MARSIYEVEDEVESVGEVAESSARTYWLGLPIIAIVFNIVFLVFLRYFRKIVIKVKKMNLGANLDQIRHQVNSFL